MFFPVSRVRSSRQSRDTGDDRESDSDRDKQRYQKGRNPLKHASKSSNAASWSKDFLADPGPAADPDPSEPRPSTTQFSAAATSLRRTRSATMARRRAAQVELAQRCCWWA